MTDAGNGIPDRRISTPNPDPTTLTTAALLREIGSLRELFAQKMADRDKEFMAATSERNAKFDSLRDVLNLKIDSAARLTDERFAATERQRIEQKVDTKSAVDAALIAQKEAVREQTTASERAIAKSEAATTKQLEQQQLTVATSVEALRTQIAEVKDRAVEENRNIRTAISEVATITNATVQQKAGAREDRTSAYATIGILITIVLFLMALAAFLATKPGV